MKQPHHTYIILTNHATAADLEAIVLNTPELDNRNKRYADNVMDVFTSANAELIKERIKEPRMSKAVDELFAEKSKKLEAIIADKDSQLADQQSQIEKKDALIAKLQAELEKYAGKTN